MLHFLLAFLKPLNSEILFFMLVYRENKIAIFDSIKSEYFHPNFIIYGVINVVIIVIVPIIGSRKELVTPISVPPLATTKANSPPEDDNPKLVFNEVELLNPCAFADMKTVRNLATMDITTNIITGSIKIGRSRISISAPTETKNNAANISLIGVARTLVTECTLDSAISTPAKNAPVATDIPISYATKDN